MIIQVCRCGTQFVMRPHHQSQKLNPICADADPTGNVDVLDDGSYRIIKKDENYTGQRFKSHFANCPHAGSFKR